MLHKEAVFQHILPIFLQLLKDEQSDVRLNIISKLDSIHQVIGIELLSQSLLPAIIDLAGDKKWRCRLGVSVCVVIFSLFFFLKKKLVFLCEL